MSTGRNQLFLKLVYSNGWGDNVLGLTVVSVIQTQSCFV